MQHKVHMQDQVTNRIELIMGDQRKWLRQVVEDLVTLSFIVTILALGIIW